MKTINCAECNKEFKYEPNPHYRDNRKYCDPCGLARKVAWETQGDAEPEVEHIKIPNAIDRRAKDNGFEAHLSIETVRSNALASAIECASKLDLKYRIGDVQNLLGLAHTFEQYILTGE